MGEGVAGREGSFMTPPSGRDGSRDPPPPVQQRKGISGQGKPSQSWGFESGGIYTDMISRIRFREKDKLIQILD